MKAHRPSIFAALLCTATQICAAPPYLHFTPTSKPPPFRPAQDHTVPPLVPPRDTSIPSTHDQVFPQSEKPQDESNATRPGFAGSAKPVAPKIFQQHQDVFRSSFSNPDGSTARRLPDWKDIRSVDGLPPEVKAAVAAGVTFERSTQLTVTISKDGTTSEQTVDIPRWELFNLDEAVVQRRMAEAFAHVPKDAPIFFNEMPPGVPTSDILPGRIAARTFDSSSFSAESHIRNFERIRTTRLDVANTKLFNFVGPTRGSSPMKAAKWARLRALYDSATSRLGLKAGSSKAELLESLAAGELDVIVVVAHGTKNSIELPDGTAVTVDEVRQLPPLADGKRAPIVVLLSCETGSSAGQGFITIGEALMLKGRASAVFAPTREVSAEAGTVRVLEEFIASASRGKLDDWVQRLRGPWQVIVEMLGSKASTADASLVQEDDRPMIAAIKRI